MRKLAFCLYDTNAHLSVKYNVESGFALKNGASVSNSRYPPTSPFNISYRVILDFPVLYGIFSKQKIDKFPEGLSYAFSNTTGSFYVLNCTQNSKPFLEGAKNKKEHVTTAAQKEKLELHLKQNSDMSTRKYKYML